MSNETTVTAESIDTENAQINTDNASMGEESAASSVTSGYGEDMESYDLTAEWDAEVDGMVDTLIEKCRDLRIPIVVIANVSVGIGPEKMKTHCASQVYTPDRRTDNRMAALRYLIEADDADLITHVYRLCAKHQSLQMLKQKLEAVGDDPEKAMEVFGGFLGGLFAAMGAQRNE